MQANIYTLAAMGGKTPTNTRITYQYRDADNYKLLNSHVIAGGISGAQIAEILDCLDGGERFVPSAVGLPEERFGDGYNQEVDGPWFELGSFGFASTTAPADLGLSVSDLVANFRRASGSWEIAAEESEKRLCAEH